MIPYSNNDRIVEFFNKAQVKIAELGIKVADEEYEEEDNQLLLRLSDFLESLDSPYNTWTEIEILYFIDYWYRRANLYSIPYIQITNYQVSINTGGNTSPIGDISSLIYQVLTTFPHNNLFALQGGTSSERYHLTKAEHDWLQCQMSKTPCPDIIQPTVSLIKTSNGTQWQSGYYELGTTVSSSVLQGVINLNSGGLINYYRYLRGTTELDRVTSPLNTAPISSYTDRTLITVDTTYTFEANFQVGGSKQDSKSILFRQPIYTGILQRNLANLITALSLTKDVRDKGYFEFSPTLPVNNTLITNGTDQTPVVFIPGSWGLPSSIKVLDYDFLLDWTFTQQSMLLQDGSSQSGLLGIYNKNFEGTTTFKFSF